jgi:hypothetical protein
VVAAGVDGSLRQINQSITAAWGPCDENSFHGGCFAHHARLLRTLGPRIGGDHSEGPLHRVVDGSLYWR